MLMKYKDFKTMSLNDMKSIKGGVASGCSAKAYCNAAGTESVSCSGDHSCMAQDFHYATCFVNGGLTVVKCFGQV